MIIYDQNNQQIKIPNNFNEKGKLEIDLRSDDLYYDGGYRMLTRRNVKELRDLLNDLLGE